MPTNTSDLRAQLILIIADALAANDDKARTPHDIATEAMQQSGLRRAAWACFTPGQQGRMINEARKRAGGASDATQV